MEQVWEFGECSPDVLVSALAEAGMGDVLPDLPEGEFTGFAIDALY